MENSIFISVGLKDGQTLITIRQFNKEDGTLSKDGLIIPINEFALFMFQLKSIEHSFITAEQPIVSDEVVDGKW